MQTKQIRIRITDAETKELEDLAGRCDLNETTLAAVIVRAGLRAIWENGGKITLPLTFHIAAQSESAAHYLNEPKGKLRK